jgi:nucleoside-diphosphate-sugar epimerase
VRGVDCFTDNYEPALKRANAALVADHPGHEAVDADLVTADPVELLDGVDAVLHLAGQPGVRDSWADGFETYVERNVVATQRLLEAARDSGISRFAAASSSSVYGDAETYPTTEAALPRPSAPTASPSSPRSTCAPVRHELRRAHRVAALLHRLRPRSAPTWRCDA